MLISDQGVPLVVFSGGLDSTYLLCWMLQNYKEVDILTVELKGHVYKTPREKQARERIIAELVKMRRDDPDKFGKIRHHREEQGKGFIEQGILPIASQPLEWMRAAMHSLSTDTTKVVLGYVKSDSNERLESMVKAWDLLIYALHVEAVGGKVVNLEFPIIGCEKEFILTQLPINLLRHVSWCETQSPKQFCNSCMPCVKMFSTLLAAENLGILPPAVRSYTSVVLGRFKDLFADEVSAMKRVPDSSKDASVLLK